MPDHLHLLAEGADKESDLLEFVTSFKKETAFDFERKEKQRLWQFKFYDHILRSAAAIDAVCWYIWLNPVRKGICRTPGEYAFSGSFTEQGMKLLKEAPATGWIPPWKNKL
jgi:putative transposase